MKVVLEQLSPSAGLLIKAHAGDVGYDLCAAVDARVAPHQFARIATDLAIQLPKGLWARIVGRSSLFAEGLLVREGIIDNGYRGELGIGVFNLSRKTFVVRTGDRLAQLIFHTQVSPEFHYAVVPPDSERGTSGEGSTGR